jgi:hypothetical protein
MAVPDAVEADPTLVSSLRRLDFIGHVRDRAT